jgi:hypothetical protein
MAGIGAVAVLPARLLRVSGGSGSVLPRLGPAPPVLGGGGATFRVSGGGWSSSQVAPAPRWRPRPRAWGSSRGCRCGAAVAAAVVGLGLGAGLWPS